MTDFSRCRRTFSRLQFLEISWLCRGSAAVAAWKGQLKAKEGTLVKTLRFHPLGVGGFRDS